MGTVLARAGGIPQRRPWAAPHGWWRTLADVKQRNDTIRWCFRKLSRGAVRRTRLSGEIRVREIRESTSQPEKRSRSVARREGG